MVDPGNSATAAKAATTTTKDSRGWLREFSFGLVSRGGALGIPWRLPRWFGTTVGRRGGTLGFGWFRHGLLWFFRGGGEGLHPETDGEQREGAQKNLEEDGQIIHGRSELGPGGAWRCHPTPERLDKLEAGVKLMAA